MTAIVLQGDARHLPLPDASVDLIVTSPPFWGQRDYQDAGVSMPGQIGSEATWQEWLANLLDCTREWVRVLKPDGNLFVELGDKFSSGASNDRSYYDPEHYPTWSGKKWRGPSGPKTKPVPGMRPKCLLDLPHRYSIACVDQLGLIKRANIVWHHTNGLPESVTDRVRVAHTMVFHLVKQPRYYTAIDEIREPHEAKPQRRFVPMKPRKMNQDVVSQAESDERWVSPGMLRSEPGNDGHPLGKLPGSVWSIPSQPLQVPAHLGVDHYAAWPMEVPRRLVLGWSPPGICVACGQGRRPVVTRELRATRGRVGLHKGQGRADIHDAGSSFNWSGGVYGGYEVTVTGYVCACPTPDAPTRPSVILDPFGGTGTTALVASMLGRTGVSIDRSADYTRLAHWRVRDPAERAKALQVPKPPPVPDGQDSLFDLA